MADNSHVLATDKESHFCFDTRFAMQLDAQKFPFRTELSMAPLVTFWQQNHTGKQPARVSLGKMALDALRQAPELIEPIHDVQIINRHRELVDILMSLVFPPASWEQAYMAAMAPYQLQSFYATPSFERLFTDGDGVIAGCMNIDIHTVAWIKVMHAYTTILQRLYGINIDFEYPLIFTALDPNTGLPRHFQVQFDPRFVNVKTTGALPTLTEAKKKRLCANVADTQVLMEILPPEQFIFHGFTVCTAVEVTEQEVLSSLKRELIDRESIVSNTRFQSLENELRTLFRRPHLRFGLAALQGKEVLILSSKRQIEHGCIFADSMHHQISDFAGSIYERAVTQGELLLIDDLEAYQERTSIEEELLRSGVRNMIIAPLYYRDELIGTLDLASPHTGDLNALNAVKLREVLPLFSMAIKRSMDELNANIQAVIKEECTAIHPAVEWRFRQAALPYMMQRRAGLPAEMGPIVFDNIHPLYAVSDIRGSTTQRNAAIQADLAEHLRLAHAIVQLAYQARPLPILAELAYRINKQVEHIEEGLGSGDEVTLIDFLRREVEPLFEHFQTFAPEIQEKIQNYRHTIAPHIGTLYRRRKDFEDSVMLINETISTYLESEEAKAQAMFPHYFEKHKSDGVEFGIYIGASLVEDGQFNELYLHNLRLWQLMVMCGIVRKMANLQSQLKLPLQTAHLILVQHAPLSIRFRFDEKRFDVDGAYNMRYEIIKKRIDKATIQGSGERLTQPEKIAIVYSHPSEAAEYREYIEYLQTLGDLSHDVEEVELNALEGVHGLKALRVTVALQEGASEPVVALRQVMPRLKQVSA